MTIKEALKNLFKSRGGNEADIKGKNIAGIINAMAGSSSEPGGTHEAAPSGGVLIVPCERIQGRTVSSVTAEEVVDALDAGMLIAAKTEESGPEEGGWEAETRYFLFSFDHLIQSDRYMFHFVMFTGDSSYAHLELVADGMSDTLHTEGIG